MRWVSLSIFILLLIGSVSESAWGATRQRYLAVFRDGTVASSDQPPTSWHETGSGARFAGRALFDTTPELLLLRDRFAQIERTPPYLVMGNGDVLPGAVVGFDMGNAALGYRPTLYVAPEGGVEPMQGERLAIRADRVQRIVAAPLPSNTAASENTVLLTDGRKFAARSLRFTPYGLSLLTDGGVVSANFAELALVEFAVDRAQALLEDSIFAGSQTETRVVRLTNNEGAILTGARMFRYTLRNNGRRARDSISRTLVVLQPAWALEALSVLDNTLVQSSFRQPTELPLSLLTISTLAQRGILGAGIAWQRDASVTGEPLASGELEADWGLGTHAHNELAIDLPAGAQTLELRLGIERAMGNGGCIVGRILRDSVTGDELWSSGILRGGEAPKATGELLLAGAQRVVLVTEFGHVDRPTGADPFDVRDQAVWLSPIVRIDAEQILASGRLAALLGGAHSWEIDPAALKHARFSGVWNGQTNRWDPLLRVAADQQLTLRRNVSPTVNNDVLELTVATPPNAEQHDFELLVDGEPIPCSTSVERQHASSVARRRANQPQRGGVNALREQSLEDALSYWWDLQAYHGRSVQLELRLKGAQGGSEVVWRSLVLRGAISNLPSSGKLPAVDVKLTTLKPLAVDANLPALGTLPLRGKPAITFVGQQHSEGHALAKNQRISFTVPPEQRKFAALVGASMGEAGPLRILMNDRVAWESPPRLAIQGAEWVEVPIPVGTEKLTLEVGNETSHLGFGAFTNAGFMLTGE